MVDSTTQTTKEIQYSTLKDPKFWKLISKGLAQLSLEGLDLCSQALHLLRLGGDRLGLLGDQVLDRSDLALDGVCCDGSASGDIGGRGNGGDDGGRLQGC